MRVSPASFYSVQVAEFVSRCLSVSRDERVKMHGLYAGDGRVNVDFDAILDLAELLSSEMELCVERIAASPLGCENQGESFPSWTRMSP